MPYAYGIETEIFNTLERQVEELPEELSSEVLHPDNVAEYRDLCSNFIDAFDTMLQLTKKIMVRHLEIGRRGYLLPYIEGVYDKATKRILSLLRSQLEEDLKNNTEALVDLIHDIKESQAATELRITGDVMRETENDSDIGTEEHLKTVTTVTNSLKKLLERYAKWKPIKMILHAINEVIGIVLSLVV